MIYLDSAATVSYTHLDVYKRQVSLLAKSDMASFVDSLVAPLSLVNALIVAISREKAVHLESSLNRLERDVYKRQRVHALATLAHLPG